MTRLATAAWGLALVLLSVVLPVSLAEPAAAAAKGATTIDLRLAAPLQPKLPHAVVVHLTGPNGSAVTGAEVGVYVDVTLFGGRSALLGKAVTDSAGDARVAIRPDKASYKIRAKFAGNDTLAASETVKTISVPKAEIGAAPQYSAAAPLAGVKRNAPRIVTALVVIVWMLLLVGAVWVLRRIHHHGVSEQLEPAGR